MFRAGVRLKVALSVLQSIGTLEPEEIGKTDPQQSDRTRRLIFRVVPLNWRRVFPCP